VTEARVTDPDTHSRYPVGVLFIHGIGEPPRGDTLKRFADPIVRSLDLWITCIGRKRGRTVGSLKSEKWAREMPSDLREADRSMAKRVQAWGLAIEARNEADLVKPTDRAILTKATIWSGAAVLVDGHLLHPSATADAPPHAVLDVHWMDEQYKTAQKNILLAESWWGQSFVPSQAADLFAWTFKILPMAIGMHMGDFVRRAGQRVGDRTASIFSRAWAALSAIPAFASMMLFTPLSLVLQAALSITIVIGFLPFATLQRLMRGVQRALTGSLGDSFLVTASPVSRASMVGQFKRDLEWLADRCEKVILVAHSQGCAVSFLGLCERRFENLCQVIWLGSGVRKLEVLRSSERNPALLRAGWWVAAIPLIVIAFRPWPHTWSSGTILQILVLLSVAIFYLHGVLELIFQTRADDAARWVQYQADRGTALIDMFATHDPVSNGAFVDSSKVARVDFETQRLRNRRSVFSDHTTYWTNIEEVALPLGLRIAAMAGIPLDAICGEPDIEWLKAMQQRRGHRVGVLVALRWLFVAAVAFMVYDNPIPWLTFIQSAWGALPSLVQGNSSTETFRSQLFGVAPMLAVVAAAYMGQLLIWRQWDRYEQRSLFEREMPSGFRVVLLLACAGVCLFLPLTLAMAHRFNDAVWPWIQMSVPCTILFASLYIGIFDPRRCIKWPYAAG
jgi:hypothetical protein